MSADNGIYIGNFAGNEFRVIEAVGFEINYPTEFNASAIVQYYKDSICFTEISKAFEKAHEFTQNGYTEYGIYILYFPKSFAEYEQEDKINPDPYWHQEKYMTQFGQKLANVFFLLNEA